MFFPAATLYLLVRAFIHQTFTVETSFAVLFLTQIFYVSWSIHSSGIYNYIESLRWIIDRALDSTVFLCLWLGSSFLYPVDWVKWPVLVLAMCYTLTVPGLAGARFNCRIGSGLRKTDQIMTRKIMALLVVSHGLLMPFHVCVNTKALVEDFIRRRPVN